jgi:hypothetical protein
VNTSPLPPAAWILKTPSVRYRIVRRARPSAAFTVATLRAFKLKTYLIRGAPPAKTWFGANFLCITSPQGHIRGFDSS